jgi:hypothetical protein
MATAGPSPSSRPAVVVGALHGARRSPRETRRRRWTGSLRAPLAGQPWAPDSTAVASATRSDVGGPIVVTVPSIDCHAPPFTRNSAV